MDSNIRRTRHDRKRRNVRDWRNKHTWTWTIWTITSRQRFSNIFQQNHIILLKQKYQIPPYPKKPLIPSIGMVFIRWSGRKSLQQWYRSSAKRQFMYREQQTVFFITDDPESNFIPACHNPFEEPISVGQYVLWEMSHAMPVCQEPDSPHSKLWKLQLTSILSFCLAKCWR